MEDPRASTAPDIPWSPSGASRTLGYLAALASRLAAEPDPVAALLLLVSTVRRELGLDRAGIFAVAERPGVLERVVGTSCTGEPEFAGKSFSITPPDGADHPLTLVARGVRPHYLGANAPAEFPAHVFEPGVRALVVLPIAAGGELLGVLCADNALTGREISPALLRPLKVLAGLAALPLFTMAARRLRHREEILRRHICREILLAVTDGKFQLCDGEELAREWPAGEEPICLCEERDVGRVREVVRRTALAAGLDPERAADLALSVSEAATNALLHGNGGYAAVAADDRRVRVRVVDRGNGIATCDIPSATLVRGWSRRSSLGLGFTIMNETADRVLMATGPEGTALILEMDLRREPPAAAATLDDSEPLHA